MRILVINPNTTASMTAQIGRVARAAARAGTEIVADNPAHGPAAIEGAADGEAALPGIFDLFDRHMQAEGGFDAAVIACFDDTGLAELKARSAVSVLGIGEAAFHAAMMVGSRFTVITSLSVSIPVIEDNLRRYGFADRCARVRASGVPVLDLERDPSGAAARIGAAVGSALDEDDASTIVLGCAGMAGFAAEIAGRFGVPVVEGIGVGVAFSETLGIMPR